MQFADIFKTRAVLIEDDEDQQPRRDSGAAALQGSQSAAQQASQSARSKYTGVSTSELNARTRMVAARRSNFVTKGAEDLSRGNQAVMAQKDKFTPTQVYDLRPDLKPRPITYRQVFH